MQKSEAALPALLVCVACAVMAVVDGVIQPGYALKSAVKLTLFLLLPLFYARYDRSCDLKTLFRAPQRSVPVALAFGAGVYAVIMLAYLLLRDVIDFAALSASLTESTGVHGGNFLFVSIYISFVNSLLEEFFFRGFAFLELRRRTSRPFAYCFSALAFSLYHVAMMIGWFSPLIFLLALAGLFVGGVIFNVFNERFGNIYLSWLIHMFANFAINTVGFLMFAAQ